MGFSNSARILTVAACVCTFCAMVFHAVAFGTRQWLSARGLSPFRSIGFHEACFDNCRDPYCPTGDPDFLYDGCWWLWDWHFMELWQWLRPEWFMTCRTMTIINVPLTAICTILLVFCSLIVMLGKYTTDEHQGRDRVLIILLYITAAVLLVSAILGLWVLGEFYENAFHLSWMPMPDKNELGWSYWLEVVAVILLASAAVLTVVAAIFKTIRFKYEKVPEFSEDMMMGRY